MSAAGGEEEVEEGCVIRLAACSNKDGVVTGGVGSGRGEGEGREE